MKIIKNFIAEEYSKKLIEWLKKICINYPAEGFVIGISGGIDSAVAASLAVKTGLPTTALILPSKNNQDQDMKDGLELIKNLDIEHHIVPIQPAYDTFIESTLNFTNSQNDRQHVIKGNAQARLRMMYLYAYAQQNNRIVIGTDNACEWYMGYFTKFGDGAADILPLVNLKKSQVFEMGKYLKVPQNIIDKAPSAGLWQGQTDEDEMGVTYQEIDNFLDGKEVSAKALERINFWHNRSHHKRSMAFTPNF
ncbi:NAD(+) synthase [Francisella philomiragia]|uniref:NH(3)-dependent NAD(+) synthetase n=2 Tax=Francisella philomiragia TaxID=28110 RepID=A0AAW3DAP7_9GAMM|nr:NAD(+) synthase [Francisella philomiragia]AJI46917.1 putative NH(3)-dependent NAD(+) synthetase [Francisella philomiragia]AJI49496.1 NH(3)-dependent NAD(+) synthetase [Francisella philomiragia]AJI74527.1 NH(3)-dependent NAD(+) synthetase [Francisella philomiragia subsp. philomiragia ATCC 25015]EET21170.1 NH(3)-dependent NAD(+) synthetase [Francisella philomiragia subsp. philomiragia ATCC 25015]KFJ42593.1 putative NH(3)-dependent NAD(+) synthetase [Francisella philomiragia]